MRAGTSTSERPTTVTRSRPGPPRPGRPAPPPPGPAPPAPAPPAPPPGAGTGARPRPAGIRLAVERASAAPLVYLRQLPAWLVPLMLAGFLVAGFAARG